MQLDDKQRAAQEQFGRQSARYGKSHILADVSDVVAALERIDLVAPADALDVATGGGHAGLYLASLGHRVTLADVAAPMLEQAAAEARAQELEVATEQHPAEAMPYADASFDLVICRVAPHHFSRPEAFIAESARVLRPGGWFVVIDGSVPDGHPVAEAWTHDVEKLRDPSHGRFITPQGWRERCDGAGLAVASITMKPFKQPDLEWYFETANTPPENRDRVRELVASAPDEARELFRVGEEDGKIVWWWQRLTLIARK